VVKYPEKRTQMPKQVKLIALLKFKPGMSNEEIKTRWVDKHAPYAMKMKNLRGYRINIATDDYQEIEGELPYDGTAELWWDSLEDMKQDLSSMEGRKAGEDAGLFAVIRTHIYTEEYIIK
jgi:uncharacterized protein (TIGR02118 family)